MNCSRKELIIAVGISLGIILLCVTLSIAGYFYLVNQSTESEATPSPSGTKNTQQPEPSATPQEEPEKTETTEKLSFMTNLEKSYLFTNTLESLICIFSLVLLLGGIFVLDYVTKRRNKNGKK